MSRTRILLPLLLALTTATLVFGAPPAAAKRPCWQALFVDYADGRIDKTYPVHCYRDAVKNLGEDQLTYGTAADDINRALQAAIIKLKKHGVPITANTKIPPGPGKPGGGSGGGSSSSGGGGTGSNQHDENFFDRVLHAIGPTSADSVPLPLVILAGLAMLLLAAAATSLIARRVQARRTPPPAPSPTPPHRRP